MKVGHSIKEEVPEGEELLPPDGFQPSAASMNASLGLQPVDCGLATLHGQAGQFHTVNFRLSLFPLHPPLALVLWRAPANEHGVSPP